MIPATGLRRDAILPGRNFKCFVVDVSLELLHEAGVDADLPFL
jgi:hypothetical protein